ncbi:MAG: molybdopterin molybdotransferase MoeA [Thermoplasmata archaeon]|nr:molybdopterin molybdotransferase MoeA [Thermoplasmata archaeon]
MKMRPFGTLIPAEEARRRLLAAVEPLRRTERVGLGDALGRVAAETVRAPRAVPAFARATWDGYALSARGTRNASPARPVRLKIVGEIYAEEQLPRPLGLGECAAIATGGALPRGADAVVIFEVVERRGDAILVSRRVRLGNRVANPGDDFPRGAVLLERGRPLTPASLGALASTGRTHVRVVGRPRVTIIPNGNELVEPGRKLTRGKIYESNNLALGAVVRATGAELRPLPPVRDDPARIEAAIRRAVPRSDLVLLTGGSSVGERDYLPSIFPKLGRLLFHGVAVRPGKPTLAVRVGRTLVIGMPGHPTSCLLNGYWLLLPVLRRLAGEPGPGWWDGTVRLARAYDPPTPGLSTVIPLRVERGWGYPTFHDSSAITSLAGVHAFALVDGRHGPLTRGTRLDVQFLPSPLGDAPAP